MDEKSRVTQTSLVEMPHIGTSTVLGSTPQLERHIAPPCSRPASLSKVCPRTTFAAHRPQRSRSCGILLCLLLLGPARTSSSPRLRCRVGGESLPTCTGGRNIAGGFIVRSAVPSRSSAERRLRESVRHARWRGWLRSSHARGAASMAVTAGLEAETANQPSR